MASDHFSAPINVFCSRDEATPELLANITGYARSYTDRSALAGYVGRRVWRYFRTEVWR